MTKKDNLNKCLLEDGIDEDSCSEIRGKGVFNKVIRSIRSEERRVGKECRSRWSPYH